MKHILYRLILFSCLLLPACGKDEPTEVTEEPNNRQPSDSGTTDTPTITPTDENNGTVVAKIQAYSSFPDDYIDKINGKSTTVSYTYLPENESYIIYGGEYCSDPTANDGKGIALTAQSGANLLLIDSGDSAYVVGTLSYPYTWQVYLSVTLP